MRPEPKSAAGTDSQLAVEDPDTELIARIGRQDAEACRLLVDRHLPRMVALARRLLGNQADAEDVAQEVFMKVWLNASKWEPGRAKFETWLHRVALNLCYDRLRKKQPIPVENIPEIEDDRANAFDLHHQSDVTRRVREAIDQLPERQKAAIVLNHHQGMSNIQTAEILEISVEAVESLLSRGRRKLRELLKDEVSEMVSGL